MRHGWSDSNRFGQTLYFTKGQIDSMCEQELKKAGCFPDEPSPIRIDRFIEKTYSKIEYIDLGAGILGCTQFSAKGKIERVIVSASLDSDEKITERRLRSTLAHEAGHCMLHPILFIQDGLQSTFMNENVLLARAMKFMCRADGIHAEPERKKNVAGEWWEYQANRAIGGFLLPKRLVNSAIKHLLLQSAFAGVVSVIPQKRAEAIKTLSELFEVNPKVAEIRINEMYPENDTQTTF
jgi:hypothetical protein